MFRLAFSNLLRRKSRTFLSVFMIAVGVLSIISLVSLVDGLFYDIQKATGQIQGIVVLQKGGYGPLFSQIERDYKEKLERVQGVEGVEPVVISIAKNVEGKSLGLESFEFQGMIRLIGTDFSNKGVRGSISGVQGEIVEGKELEAGDRGRVVIGTEIKKKFNKFAGNTIKINGEKFRIVGVFRTGSKISNLSILMQIDDLRELIGFPNNKVSFFSITIENPDELDKVTELIKFKYGEKLGVVNTSQFTETISGVIGDIRMLVFVVAAIAAIVAGVGIINTMLMSIMERFKEIGALKATGWTNSNIIKMILYESFLIGVIGGITGLVLGIVLVPMLAELTGFKVFVSPTLLGETFLFAVGIGIVAGLYPAWKASRFDPIQALAME